VWNWRENWLDIGVDKGRARMAEQSLKTDVKMKRPKIILDAISQKHLMELSLS
jgi:hypothetical protein